tara:strand:- start:101 stop:235 length:135 start_codon:yes stop_codon:yes gene_type:complete
LDHDGGNGGVDDRQQKEGIIVRRKGQERIIRGKGKGFKGGILRD